MLGAQSGVPGNIKSGQQLIGTPPMEMRPYFRAQAVVHRLPELYKQINALQKEVDALKARPENHGRIDRGVSFYLF